MKDDINIRVFNLSQDYEIVRDLWENVGSGVHLGRSDGHEEIAKKLQRDPDLFLVAENNQQIIGTVLGGFDGRRGMVYHLAVRGENRNSGVGEALMEALEERLRLKGCLRYYLLVTEDNNEAMKFYEKRGWKQLELFVYGKDLSVKE
jgi:ribosomal protein S18 acetylase RimI-like enzyme